MTNTHQILCYFCGGRGYFGNDSHLPCPQCDGLGKRELTAPTKTWEVASLQITWRAPDALVRLRLVDEYLRRLRQIPGVQKATMSVTDTSSYIGVSYEGVLSEHELNVLLHTCMRGLPATFGDVLSEKEVTTRELGAVYGSGRG